MHNPTTGAEWTDAERDAYFYAIWGVLGNLFPSINLEEWIFFMMKMLADRKRDERMGTNE